MAKGTRRSSLCAPISLDNIQMWVQWYQLSFYQICFTCYCKFQEVRKINVHSYHTYRIKTEHPFLVEVSARRRGRWQSHLTEAIAEVRWGASARVWGLILQPRFGWAVLIRIITWHHFILPKTHVFIAETASEFHSAPIDGAILFSLFPPAEPPPPIELHDFPPTTASITYKCVVSWCVKNVTLTAKFVRQQLKKKLFIALLLHMHHIYHYVHHRNPTPLFITYHCHKKWYTMMDAQIDLSTSSFCTSVITVQKKYEIAATANGTKHPIKSLIEMEITVEVKHRGTVCFKSRPSKQRSLNHSVIAVANSCAGGHLN